MKPTTSESILLHSMLSAAVAVIMGFGISIAQFYFAHGQDLVLTGSFAVGSFAATFAAIRTAVWHAAITSPALAQSKQDALAQTMQLAQDAHTKIDSLAGSVLPFVHQHPATPAPATQQGRVSNAVTASTPRPITFPPAPAAHFDTGMVPVPPQSA